MESKIDIDEGEFRLSVGERIRACRLRKKVKPIDLSMATGISRSTLSKIENGKMSLPVARVQLLALALGVPVIEFLGEAEGEHGESENGN